MSSGISIEIKLDPFLQHLLRFESQIVEGVFRFKKNSDLSVKLGVMLKRYPSRVLSHSEWYGNLDLQWFYPPTILRKKHAHDFEIELPYQEHKNVLYYNYLSPKAELILQKHIKQYYTMIFHEEMNRLRNMGFQKKECLQIFMEQKDIDEDNLDRLQKDYYRYIKKSSKIKSLKKPKKHIEIQAS